MTPELYVQRNLEITGQNESGHAVICSSQPSAPTAISSLKFEGTTQTECTHETPNSKSVLQNDYLSPLAVMAESSISSKVTGGGQLGLQRRWWRLLHMDVLKWD